MTDTLRLVLGRAPAANDAGSAARAIRRDREWRELCVKLYEAKQAKLWLIAKQHERPFVRGAGPIVGWTAQQAAAATALDTTVADLDAQMQRFIAEELDDA